MKSKRFLMGVIVVCLGLATATSFVVSCAAPAPTPTPPAAPAPTPTPPLKPIEVTIELRHSDIHPELYPFADILKDYVKEVEEATEGRVKFTMYFGGSLTQASEIYDGVAKGVSDTGFSVFCYNPGRFPVMEVCDLPGFPSVDAYVTSHVGWDVYNKFKPAELNDVHILFVCNSEPGGCIATRKPVNTLEDLKGLRLRCVGSSAPTATALGAIPVALPITEAYTLLEKGTVDGSFLGLDDLTSMRVGEICHYTVMIPPISQMNLFFMAMNLDTWNSLPADVKKVFDEVSPKYVEISAAKWNEMSRLAYEQLKEMGHTFTHLSAEELDKTIELVVRPLQDKYVTDMEAKGLPGSEILAYRHEREQWWFTILGPGLVYE